MSRTQEPDHSSSGSSKTKLQGPSEPTLIDEIIEAINDLRAANSDKNSSSCFLLLQEQLQSSRTELKETEAAARAEHCALKSTMDSLSEDVKNYKVFHEQLKAERKCNDELHFRNKLLRVKIGALKDKEEAMRELKSKRAAMEEENKKLQQEFEHLWGKVPNNSGETYSTVLKETERVRKENSARTEQVVFLREWYKQNTALCEEYEFMKTEKQVLSEENDQLQQEIQQIDNTILNQNTLFDAFKVLHETVSCQNTALQRELERLSSEYENAKQFSDSYNESLSRMEGLRKENDDLREQIENVNGQLQSIEFSKDKYKELEAEEKSAMAQNRVLAKTYSEKLKKLAKEEDWKHKHDKLKEQIDALKQESGQIVEDIQGCNENLEELNDLKVQHKPLKAEKKKKLVSSVLRWIRAKCSPRRQRI